MAAAVEVGDATDEFQECQQLDYERNGYVYCRGAVAAEDVAALRSYLWEQACLKSRATWNGLKPEEPKSYPKRWPLLNISLFPEPHSLWEPLWQAPAVRRALDNLVGPGRWDMPVAQYHFYFPIKLPEPHAPGAIAEATNSRGEKDKGWHVDLGKNFCQRGLGGNRTLTNGPDHAAVVLFLLSDTRPGEGGTMFLPGSPRVVANALREHQTGEGGEGGMSHEALLRFCNDHVVSGLKNGRYVYEEALKAAATRAGAGAGAGAAESTTSDDNFHSRNTSAPTALHAYAGKAGDVIIFHPWAIHAASRNFTDRDQVRFMCNAAVRYSDGAFNPWFTDATADELNVRAATTTASTAAT